LPRSLLNPEFERGAPSHRWPRRWRFLAVLVAAGLGWAVPLAVIYVIFWRA
jgi:hypothetical protein